MFILPSSFAFDTLQDDFQTKNVVRLKLWYEGLENNSINLDSYKGLQAKRPMIEELSTALDMFDQ